MPSAANPRRFSIATLGLIAFAHAQAALGADGDTTGNFETVRAWTDTIGRFNKAIADKITEITSFGSDYYKIGMVFMTALGAIYLVIAITNYVFRGKDWPQLL